MVDTVDQLLVLAHRPLVAVAGEVLGLAELAAALRLFGQMGRALFALAAGLFLPLFPDRLEFQGDLMLIDSLLRRQAQVLGEQRQVSIP